MVGASRWPRITIEEHFYGIAYFQISPGSSGRSETPSKGAKASTQVGEAKSERAKGNTGVSKRSSMGGEKSLAEARAASKPVLSRA